MPFDDIVAPQGLLTDEFILRPILESDTELDYLAVMETKEVLRIWEGGGYPADDFSVDDNRDDLAKMEKRFNDRHSYAYTVMNADETETLGCVYVFPTDVSWLSNTVATPISDDTWDSYGANVRFWVRTSRVADGLDRRLIAALVPWFENDWPRLGYAFTTTTGLTEQIAAFEAAGLTPKFELVDPADEGDGDLGYA